MKKPFQGVFRQKDSSATVSVSVELVYFEDEQIHYYYAPSLELMGYGLSETEARASWETVLEEYISYVMNKKTLKDDLVQRGWKVKRKNREFTPPPFTYILKHNEQLQDVFNNHDFRKSTTSVQLPALV